MTTLQITSILALFLCEALCIYSEMLVARGAGWLWTFFLITLAGIPLLIGYRYGYQSFGSMWPVMVVSVVSILIVEPLLVTMMFKETPSWGSVAGFVCGVVGLYLTLRY
jgi:hypothetical protein